MFMYFSRQRIYSFQWIIKEVRDLKVGKSGKLFFSKACRNYIYLLFKCNAYKYFLANYGSENMDQHSFCI